MSRWAAAFRAATPYPAAEKTDKSDKTSRSGPSAVLGSVNSVNFVSPSESADSAAIAAEPPLPAPGTPERDRLDVLHRESVTGYWQAALRWPPSWADSHALPSAGCCCSCCGGNAWWCEAASSTGWRCSACHPAPQSWPASAVREAAT